MITQAQLKEVLHYCPETGVFTWLIGRPGRRKGSEAGCVNRGKHSGKSYRHVGVHNRDYLAHRLAFLYMTGDFPEDQVDHMDGNGLNNAWSNLRAVTGAENSKNIRKCANNTSGTTGVYWDRRKRKWQVKIKLPGLYKSLGYFHNKEEAIAARKAAEVFYGFHENHGTERPL